MKRLLAAFCFAALGAGAALAGPVAGRTIVLDVADQAKAWSNISTRGEAYYLKAELRNRGAAYTNNDLRGYLWYATNSLSSAGVKINSYTNDSTGIWFYLSATNTLGLSTNAESYFSQIILTNSTGTLVYDWKQGRFATRHGSGLTGTGVSPSVGVVNWDTFINIGTVPWSGSGISGATATTIVHNVTDAGFAAGTNYTDTATNTLRVWVQAQGYGAGGGAVTSVFGRAGIVTAQAGDYTAGQVGAMTGAAVSNLTDSATNRLYAIEARTSYWETAWINSTQWVASVAYGITSGMTSQWDQAYIAGTNWLGSVASGITSAMTNQWTTAYGWGNHAGAGYLLPASTQTIAGASVSGTVALSSDSTNCLDLAGLRMMAGNINMGGRWSITNLFSLSGTGNVALTYGTALPTISASQTYGNMQLGYNTGTMGISNGVAGAIQRGSCASGIMSINTMSHGAEQAGLSEGRMIMSGAIGSKQLGHVDTGAAATNRGDGAIQLLDLSTGQVADTTTGGDGSLLLGAGTNSHRYAIVAGDGQVSHGDGSITAGGGFWGSGANVTGVDAATLDGIDSTGFATPAQATDAAAAVMSTGTVYNALNLGGVAAASYVTNGQPGVSFSGTTTLTNLVVNGAQTNKGALVVEGGGNVVTNGGATINGQAVSNGAAITVSGGKVVLRQLANFPFAANTATFLPATNMMYVATQSWATAGNTISNSLVTLSAGRYLVSLSDTVLAGAGGSGRYQLHTVIGATTTTVSTFRSPDAATIYPYLTFIGGPAYVTSSVPFGVGANLNVQVVNATNDATRFTLVLEQLP